jgi:nucleoside 2-deoxyribosyltransferase
MFLGTLRALRDLLQRHSSGFEALCSHELPVAISLSVMPSERSKPVHRSSRGEEVPSLGRRERSGDSPPRPMSIKVGCAWASVAHAIPVHLRKSIERSAESARSRVKKSLPRARNRATDLVDVRALRGSAGRTILDAVIDDIRRADLLVFDITPLPGSRHGVANVILELGVALGMGKPVILCRRGPFDPRAVCSDLLGLYVSAMDDGALDRSAQMVVMNAVVRHFASMRH